MLTLPLSRLESSRPLHIAVRIELEAARFVPDVFNRDRYGFNLTRGGEGLVDTNGRNTYLALMSFWEKARPLAAAFAYYVLAAVFFFFWLPAKHKSEYVYMAIFATVSGTFQLGKFDILNTSLSPRLNDALDLIFLFYMPAFGSITGLAFARARRSFFTWGMTISLLTPFIVLLVVPPGLFLELFKLVIIFFVAPISCIASGAVCLLQAHYLHKQSSLGTYLPVRMRRLFLFGVATVMLGIFYFLVFRGLLPGSHRIYWLGLEHLVVMIITGAIAMKEYGEQELLVSETPVSIYHRRATLPDRIAGALLTVDLKNSEWLFVSGANSGDAGKLVHTCLSHMWDAVVKEGGVILSTEGDALHAFFDQEALENPLGAALRATDGIARKLDILARRFRDQGLLPTNAMSLDFRGGIATGEIRPVWLDLGSTRQASWVETGSSNTFVESARYMDLERKVGEAGQGSVVMISEQVVARDAKLPTEFARRFRFRDLRLLGKHEKEYRCAVYLPSKNETPGSSTRAA